MSRRNRLMTATVLLLGAGLCGCGGALNILNPDFLAAVGLGERVAALPGDAPGLLVKVENRTSRWAGVDVSFRDGQDTVDRFTTTLAPGDQNGQMLPCPIKEITLGDVSNLQTPGAVVFLADLTTGQQNGQQGAVTAADAPFIEVDPFGVLLREGVNYDCGDELLFVVQPSGATRSGYQTFVFVRRSGAQ